VNAEFNWWLLIVGLVIGAGLVWLVIADWSRRDQDLERDERSAESAWIAQMLHERGLSLDPGDAEQVLALHRAYLHHLGGGIFDDELPADDETAAAADTAEPAETAEPASDSPAADVAEPATPGTTGALTAEAWLHTAPDGDAEAATPQPTNQPTPAPGGPSRVADPSDRGSLRSNPLAPRSGAGMDPEPPRPS
jgi:hypothetical protein